MSVLLMLCWALGGVSVDPRPIDEILQLVSLPVLGVALWRVSAPSANPPLIAFALIGMVIALPLWQLLPLPHAVGMSGAARQGISSDLMTAGVQFATVHPSLSALETERSLWSLLPALALFVGALSVGRKNARRLLQLLLAMVLASAAFAFFQLSLPDGSPLLMYTSWGRNFGGVFVNPNHQGTALSLGAVIAVTLFVDGRRRAHDQRNHLHWLYALACLACVVMIPLAGSRAGVLLVIVGLLASIVMLGILRWRSLRVDRAVAMGLIAAVTVAVVTLISAVALQQVDSQRQTIARETIRIGNQFAPLGVGIGNFVPVYAQSQDPKYAGRQEVNHAHNEYVQWWMEGGLPALVVVLFGLAVFGWAGWQVLSRMPSRRLMAIAAPAWCGLLVLLVHSLVDFPMRTTTLMATTGLFAGLLLNAVLLTRHEVRDLRRDAASQRA